MGPVVLDRQNSLVLKIVAESLVCFMSVVWASMHTAKFFNIFLGKKIVNDFSIQAC